MRLIRLQQYEILLKALVAHADIAGPPTELQAVQDAQLACTQKKTSGTLVGMLTERHLTSADEDDGTEEPLGDGGIWFRFRFNLGLDANQHQATAAALKELLDSATSWFTISCSASTSGSRRAALPQTPIWTPATRPSTVTTLTLRGWAQGMDEARAAMASFMRTAAFEDLLEQWYCTGRHGGLAASGAVRCLREAETQFATEGWTCSTPRLHGFAHNTPTISPALRVRQLAVSFTSLGNSRFAGR